MALCTEGLDMLSVHDVDAVDALKSAREQCICARARSWLAQGKAESRARNERAVGARNWAPFPLSAAVLYCEPHRVSD